MEAFANEVMEKEMKKMTKQQDDLDDEVLSGLSDEDIDEEGEDDDEDLEDEDGIDDEDMEDEDKEDDEGDDFFDGEDGLQEVKVGDEDSEMEMDDDEDEVQEYVDEDDDEEEEDDIFEKKGGKGAKSKDNSNNGKKKKESKSIFADYDEFAHLLEGDMYDGSQGGKKSKDFPTSTGGYSGSKRPNHRGSNRGGGHQHKRRK